MLSAESAVVMTSRVSFLETSPQVRRLMDGTSLMSEKLIQQLHAHGVDPLRVPRFSVLRLRDDAAGWSLLEEQLVRELEPDGLAASGGSGSAGQSALAGLVWRHIAQVAGPGLVPAMAGFFGLAFLRGVTAFSMIELVDEFGFTAFAGGRIEFGAFRFRDLFRAVDASGTALAFRHVAYQELLAAEFLRSPDSRDAALAPRAGRG